MPPSLVFPLPSWHVHSGRTMQYHKWSAGIDELVAAFGLTAAELNENPPICTTPLPRSARMSKSEVARLTAEHLAQLDVRERWVRINTALYWHVLPSLSFDGPDYLKDHRYLVSLVSVDQADGRALIDTLEAAANGLTQEELLEER